MFDISCVARCIVDKEAAPLLFGGSMLLYAGTGGAAPGIGLDLIFGVECAELVLPAS
jgi:hypothetical protein